jgi:hypothetical protein
MFTTSNQQDNYRIGKKYWKYVKSRKRETVGVSTLKVNGETIENSKGKAEALNEQFKSVSFATSQSFGTLCFSMDFVKINCRYGDIDSAASFNICMLYCQGH